MNNRKKTDGSMRADAKPGTKESATPPATSNNGSGMGTHFAIAPTTATASSRLSTSSMNAMP